MSNFERDAGKSMPEERLWAAVVLQAVQDMDGPNRARADMGRRWLFEDMRKDVGSFDWICKHLALSADRIRTRALTRAGRKALIGGCSKKEAIEDVPDSE